MSVQSHVVPILLLLYLLSRAFAHVDLNNGWITIEISVKKLPLTVVVAHTGTDWWGGLGNLAYDHFLILLCRDFLRFKSWNELFFSLFGDFFEFVNFRLFSVSGELVLDFFFVAVIAEDFTPLGKVEHLKLPGAFQWIIADVLCTFRVSSKNLFELLFKLGWCLTLVSVWLDVFSGY